ncbi:MAG TPA: CHRD domain-containing protein, partial [Vicinamibacteria bacterium]
MTKRTVLASAAVAAALTAGLGPIAAGHDDDHRRGLRRLRATLSGFNEYASTLSTTGRGSFQAVISRDETSIEYRLRFSNLEGNVTQAHIHFGDRHTSGGVSVWLCGTATNPGPAGTPLCADPPVDLTTGDASGTL